MSCRRPFVRALCAIIFVIGSFSAAHAADTGSITGTVVDPLGAVVTHATVTLLRDEIGRAHV